MAAASFGNIIMLTLAAANRCYHIRIKDQYFVFLATSQHSRTTIPSVHTYVADPCMCVCVFADVAYDDRMAFLRSREEAISPPQKDKLFSLCLSNSSVCLNNIENFHI